MEEKIRELEHKVEVLSGVVFILLNKTGLLNEALNDKDLVERIMQSKKKEEVQDKSISKQQEDEFTSILNDFNVDGKEIKN